MSSNQNSYFPPHLALLDWVGLGWGFILPLDFDLNRQDARADFDLTKGCLMTTTEKLYKAVKDLPEPVIAELLDFAEFLRSKMRNRSANSSDELLVDLMGGLENSATFAGDSLAIQKRLRDEWQ